MPALPDVAPICSKANVAFDKLIAPPRNWPDAPQQSVPLKHFISKVLKGKRTRLVASTTDKVDAQIAWVKVTGYAVSEVEELPDIFVAQPHTWLEHPRTREWIDCGCEMVNLQVLIESFVTPADARAAVAAASHMPGAHSSEKALSNPKSANGSPFSPRPKKRREPAFSSNLSTLRGAFM